LSAVLNQGRFDLGFYAGRIYGLVAATLVLVVLLVENSNLYGQLLKTRERERAEHRHAQARASELAALNSELEVAREAALAVDRAHRGVRLPDLHGSGEQQGTLPRAARRSAHFARGDGRSAAPSPDPQQPRQQRDQVHRKGRGRAQRAPPRA